MTYKMKHKAVTLLLVFCLVLHGRYCTVTAASPEEELRKSVITYAVKNPNGALQHYSFTDAEGKNYILDTHTAEETAAPLFSSRKKAASLPASYDLRTKNVITPIKDQGYSGACWAFGALKSAESNAITKGLLTKSNADFSESHLTWFAFHPSEKSGDKLMIDGFYPISTRKDAAYIWGGSSLLATFTLARWSGIVNESTVPFQSNTAAQQLSMAEKMKKSGEALRYRSQYHLQNVNCYDNAPMEVWKTTLMQICALSVGFYYDSDFLHRGTAGTTYYQNQYKGADAINAANHCATIVGWDDNYSRLNFPANNRPERNGAWLIANSYGTKTGDKGYFWLSYEDTSICDVYSFEIEKADNYNSNYQYDGFGWGSAVPGTTNQKGANIFRVRNDYNQSLKAVGLYTITDNQPYTIQIYKDVVSGYPTSGTLVSASTTSGTITYNGFHTIKLNKPVTLSAGQRFSVVVTYKTNGRREIYLPIEGIGQTSSRTQSLYDSRSGQSFYYSDTGKYWIDTSDAGQNNLCIKAFAKNTTKVPVITFSNTKARLGIGEQIKLACDTKNCSREQLSWKSSKRAVARISSGGKITAKKRGTAVITASYASAKASIKIAVKKAPSSIKTTTKKKVLKSGKKYKIKTKLSAGSASYKLKYTSSKPKIASVSDKGIVTAHKKGKAVICVRTYNKKSAKLTILVN